MYKLVRDNIPNLIKQSNQICNYAAVVNDEFFILTLKQKLVEEVNEFLNSKESIDVDELIDVQTVIDSFIELVTGEEKFKQMYNDKLIKNGGFNKRYIAFFEDKKQVSE